MRSALSTTSRRLVGLYRIYVNALGPRLAALGLHPGAEVLLTEVAAAPGCSLGELARRLGVSGASVTKVVRRLERDGLMVRAGDADDGRVSRIELTPAGRRLLPGIVAAWAEAEEIALARLSASQRAALDDLLDRAVTPG